MQLITSRHHLLRLSILICGIYFGCIDQAFADLRASSAALGSPDCPTLLVGKALNGIAVGLHSVDGDLLIISLYNYTEATVISHPLQPAEQLFIRDSSGRSFPAPPDRGQTIGSLFPHKMAVAHQCTELGTYRIEDAKGSRSPALNPGPYIITQLLSVNGVSLTSNSVTAIVR